LFEKEWGAKISLQLNNFSNGFHLFEDKVIKESIKKMAIKYEHPKLSLRDNLSLKHYVLTLKNFTVKKNDKY